MSELSDGSAAQRHRQHPTVIIVANDAEIPPETASLATKMGCKVQRASDLVIWLRHLDHALQNPMPVRRTSLIAPSQAPDAEPPSDEDLAGERELMGAGP